MAIVSFIFIHFLPSGKLAMRQLGRKPAGLEAASAAARAMCAGSGIWRPQEALEPLRPRLAAGSARLLPCGNASGAFTRPLLKCRPLGERWPELAERAEANR